MNALYRRREHATTCSAVLSNLFRGLGNSAVFLDPFAAELNSFFRGQPRPFGAAGTHRDPNRLAV